MCVKETVLVHAGLQHTAKYVHTFLRFRPIWHYRCLSARGSLSWSERSRRLRLAKGDQAGSLNAASLVAPFPSAGVSNFRLPTKCSCL